ncbi:MAG: hypothetical protein HYY61_05355 [Deltaproteobacteria bacterium]|nr:hypothetical protein [Deltaproteobacteria bacterium]
MATKITNRALLFLFLFIFAASTWAATPWEVAVIFLGSDESAEYQKDIDKNILELARITPNSSLKLSIFREFSDLEATYFSDPTSEELHIWDPLFYEIDFHGIQIPGQLSVLQKKSSEKNIVLNDEKLSSFLNRAFKIPEAHRMLVLYSHGLAFDGLRNIKLKELRSQLERALPQRPGKSPEKPIDILWLDACFMATIEVAYELRNLSSYFMASEEDEFSSGMPFDALQMLNDNGQDPKTVARNLAERFLESYSFIQEGTQRKAITSTSATLSLIETEKLDSLVKNISKLVQTSSLFPKELKLALKISNRLRKTARKDLVDLGSLLLAFKRNHFTPLETRPLVEEMITILNLTQPEKLKTNPRIFIRPEQNNSLLVYGYEHWTRGFENDALILNKLPPLLKPERFISGIENKKWPARLIHKALALSPFSAGLKEFNFWFADPQTGKFLGSPQSFTRTQDTVTFEAEHPQNPILFTGYTQGIGNSAERYSGLAILAPLQDAASLDYLETEFSEVTGWASF